LQLLHSLILRHSLGNSDLSEFKTKDAAMAGDTNSKRTRVLPIFRSFKENGGTWWPSRLLQISHGFALGLRDCGPLLKMELEPERVVSPTKERLCWMLENVDRLTPSNRSDYEKLRLRVADRDRVQKAIASLMLGGVNELGDLELEGATHADCLIANALTPPRRSKAAWD
jgi:hypothetical protein